VSAFTAREAALNAYAIVQNMGRGRVLGQPWEETRAARLATCSRAERLIVAALDSPPPWVPSQREPTDAVLQSLLVAVRRRIGELDDRR
jgi:hypothetical protein